MRDGAWEVGHPLYFWPYEELCILNYNQTINFIGVGGSSLTWGTTFCAIWGFCSIWGSFGIVWRSSWGGTLADYGVGLTQVQGGK